MFYCLRSEEILRLVSKIKSYLWLVDLGLAIFLLMLLVFETFSMSFFLIVYAMVSVIAILAQVVYRKICDHFDRI